MLFPTLPVPASVSAPDILDPMLTFQTDAQYEMRRPLGSRPRLRYQVDYLGLNVPEVRFLRDFIMVHRNGALSFEWIHPTASEVVIPLNTTPVILNYYHGLVSGMWVSINSGPTNLQGQWPVTRLDNINIALNGSVASGVAPVTVAVYLRHAVARFNENTFGSPAKLIGPDQYGQYIPPFRRGGRFNMSLSIEEVF